MNTSMKTSKDNVMLSGLIVAGVSMFLVGSAMANDDTRAVVNSASRIVQSVAAPVPAAMQPIMYREAAIIVSAPRLHAHA
jgi:hypothetical protein